MIDKGFIVALPWHTRKVQLGRDRRGDREGKGRVVYPLFVPSLPSCYLYHVDCPHPWRMFPRFFFFFLFHIIFSSAPSTRHALVSYTHLGPFFKYDTAVCPFFYTIFFSIKKKLWPLFFSPTKIPTDKIICASFFSQFYVYLYTLFVASIT